MFGISTEKKVAREVDRIVSMKEDVDALSWGRVLEIGKLLREPADGEAVAEYARELVTIAQSNLSLASRLGMDAGAPAGAVLPSGIEVVEGGYAEAALQDAQSADAASDAGKRRQIELPVIELPSITAAAESAEPATEPAIEPEKSVVEPVEAPVESVTEPGATPATELAVEPVAAPVESVAEPVAESVEQLCFEVDAPVAPEIPVPDPAGASHAPSSPTEGLDPILIEDPEDLARNAEQAEVARQADDAAPSSGPAPSDDAVPSSGPAPSDDGAAGRPSRTLSSERFARFRSLYESQDGSLCVFEDEHGHLVAVDASKLA